MLVAVRRKIGRGQAALGFQKTNPSTDPAVGTLFTKLGQLVDRAKAVIQERGEHDNASKAGTDRRSVLRRRLRVGLLRLFSRAGQVAGKADPALAERFHPIVPGITALDFAAGARSLIEAAREAGDKLAAEGVTSALIDEAEDLLAQYEAAAAQAVEARNARVKARAELAQVAGEIMGVIGRIDSLIRHRHADNPQLLAAWASATHAPGPIHGRVASEGQATPSSGGANPTDPTSGTARTA